MAMGLETLTSLGRTLFRNNRVDEICSEKPVPTALELAPSYFPRFHRPRCPRFRHLPSRSLPTELSRSHFPRFPICPKCPRFRLAPSHRSSPTVSTLPSRSLPMELSPSYFPPFPVRPQCPRFRPAPSQRSYFPRFPVRPWCPRFRLAPFQHDPIRPRCPRFHLAPLQQSSPQAISPCHVLDPQFFKTIALMEIAPKNPRHPLCIFASLPPNQGPPQAISTLHNPCTLVRRSLQRSSPQSYFHASHSIHPVSLPSVRRSRLAPCSGASPKLFLRFAVHPCAPSSLPPAELPLSYFIHASQSIHAGPALPSRSLQRRSPEAISKLFPRFPLRPRSCLPSFLSSFLPAFLPPFLPVFFPLPSFLRSFLARPALLSRSPRGEGS